VAVFNIRRATAVNFNHTSNEDIAHVELLSDREGYDPFPVRVMEISMLNVSPHSERIKA